MSERMTDWPREIALLKAERDTLRAAVERVREVLDRNDNSYITKAAIRRALKRGCPTCSGPIRETVGLVCQTCGTDYGAALGGGESDE